MNRPAAAISAIAALAAGVWGCGGSGGPTGPVTLSVYVSAPLQGPRAASGRAIENGARLALADAGGRVGKLQVRGVYLDDSGGSGWSMARTAANARRAAEDVTAIGYIGELDSGATRVSLPITNQAEIAQVSPGSTAVDLTRTPPAGDSDPDRYRPGGDQTFVRVVPADDVQAAAAAAWARRLSAPETVVVEDGSDYGRNLAAAFKSAARQRGVYNGQPQGLYLAGTGTGFHSRVRTLAGRTDGAPLFGPDALLDPAFLRAASPFAGRLRLTSPFLDPSLLPPAGRRFLRAYRARYGPPDPVAAYGYESMALLLDSIRRAGADGDDRGAVVDELLATSDRRSVLGTYSIDGDGDTTLDTVSGYRISDALPVFPVALRPPP